MECQIYVQTNIHLANIEVKRADLLGDPITCHVPILIILYTCLSLFRVKE